MGLPSAIKDSTYQQNREIKMTQTAFMSKGELRRTIEAMDFERNTLKGDNERLLEENRKVRTQLLGFQTKEINSMRGHEVLMKVVA